MEDLAHAAQEAISFNFALHIDSWVEVSFVVNMPGNLPLIVIYRHINVSIQKISITETFSTSHEFLVPCPTKISHFTKRLKNDWLIMFLILVKM